MKNPQVFWGKVLGWALTLAAIGYVLIRHWSALVAIGK